MKRVPYSFKCFKEQFTGSNASEALDWLEQHFKTVISVESYEWDRLDIQTKVKIANYYFERTVK